MPVSFLQNQRHIIINLADCELRIFGVAKHFVIYFNSLGWKDFRGLGNRLIARKIIREDTCKRYLNAEVKSIKQYTLMAVR